MFCSRVALNSSLLCKRNFWNTASSRVLESIKLSILVKTLLWVPFISTDSIETGEWSLRTIQNTSLFDSEIVDDVHGTPEHRITTWFIRDRALDLDWSSWSLSELDESAWF